MINKPHFQETGAPSRLAKFAFFRRFLKLAASAKLRPLTSDLDLASADADRRNDVIAKYRQYCDAKNAAADFQLAKNQVSGIFIMLTVSL